MKRNIQFNEYNENKKQRKGEHSEYKISTSLFYLLLCLKKKGLKFDELMFIGILNVLKEAHKLKIIKNCLYSNVIEAFKMFNNPSNDLQITAVKKNENLINCLKNPSEEVIISCVSRYPWKIREIKNPSIKVQLAAVNVRQNNDNCGFMWIKDPTEHVTITALKKNPALMLYSYKKEISEQIKIDVITSDPFLIHFIKNPSHRVQLAAVRKNPGSIMYIETPSKKVQIEAVNEHPGSIYYIKNPSEIVKSVSNLNCKYLYKYNH